MRGNCFLYDYKSSPLAAINCKLNKSACFFFKILVLSVIRGKWIFMSTANWFFSKPWLCVFQVDVKHILLERFNKKEHCKTKNLMKHSLSGSTGALSHNGMHRTKSQSNVHSYFVSKWSSYVYVIYVLFKLAKRNPR